MQEEGGGIGYYFEDHFSAVKNGLLHLGKCWDNPRACLFWMLCLLLVLTILMWLHSGRVKFNYWHLKHSGGKWQRWNGLVLFHICKWEGHQKWLLVIDSYENHISVWPMGADCVGPWLALDCQFFQCVFDVLCNGCINVTFAIMLVESNSTIKCAVPVNSYFVFFKGVYEVSSNIFWELFYSEIIDA